ncbi:SGNH/GDSL hydrolase family protein [Candidatus Woesearchaeota archaeon]|nr:SGNH/GDSL hydrolase family protein [Candidatus Woesearchaeota archaeon]
MRKIFALIPLLTALYACDCNEESEQRERSRPQAAKVHNVEKAGEPEFDLDFRGLEGMTDVFGFSLSSDSYSLEPCMKRIALVGDSHTAQSGNYITYLQKVCPDSIIANEDGNPATSNRNRGDDAFSAPGRKTDEMLQYFHKVLEWNPDAVVILGGTNDIARNGTTIDDIFGNLVAMIDMANEEGVHTVSVVPPPFMNYELLSRRYREAGEAERIINKMKALRAAILSEKNPADAVIDTWQVFEHPRGSGEANERFYTPRLIHLKAPEGMKRLAYLVRGGISE